MSKSEEPIMLKCPHCNGDFDFLTLGKNEWTTIDRYMVIRCPICRKSSKVDMED